MKRSRTFRCAAVTAQVAIWTALCAGCHNHEHEGAGHAHGGEATHEHEEKTAQITIWTNGYEVFAEHKAPVVDKPTTFITHVTDLETLEPRRVGPVKFLLQREGMPVIEHLQAGPARPGIYLPALTFPQPGSWDVQMVVEDKTIALGAVLVFTNEHAAAHTVFPDAPEGISFLKEQQWKILSGTEPVSRRPLMERVRVPAKIAAKPGHLASVAAPVSGRVLPAQGTQFPMLGDRVTQGQTLALLQPSFSELAARMVEAEAEVVRSRLAMDQADLAYKRMEALGKAEARTQREVQEAEFNLKTAQAAHEAALSLRTAYRGAMGGFGAQTNALQPVLALTAPITGIVVRQFPGALGEYVAAERHLFTILNSDTVFIEGNVPESALARVTQPKSAIYELMRQRGTFHPITGKGDGRLVHVGSQIDPQTRTLLLVYELPNPDLTLRIGELLTVYVETEHSTNNIAVPAAAIVEEDGQPVVFVQLSGETFEKRHLVTGIRDGSWVEVKEGLALGERIVIKGAYAIRLASVSATIPAHGHAH